MANKPLDPENIAIDYDTPFKPTRAFYIQRLTSDTHITSLTPSLNDIFSPETCISIDIATKLVTSTVITPAYAIKNTNLLGTRVSVTNEVGEQIAEMKCPLWSWNMGTTTIVIVGAGGGDQGEVVEIKPVGFGRRAQVFKRGGVTYFWDVEPHKHEHKSLYKVIESSDVGPKKVEVARYVQENTRTKKGVLVLDSGGVETLVGILTICAVLTVRERFTR
ncbi:hypothetical protein BKA64DRAFT_142482 [Cadophora sp. MPI-SDFR-AT-0126]|nr:hypothetical protein BKA64DRAFT_142482 [Leotiomycetes sp. MPI-SDFR-AT-0126]